MTERRPATPGEAGADPAAAAPGPAGPHPAATPDPIPPRAGVIARYGHLLPLTPTTPRISLNEGGTPLIPSVSIGPRLGIERLYFKFEGLNPTGSFKDRGMVVAVAKALEAGSTTVICASTGNTSASAAAYAGRFGLRAVVVIPEGKIAPSKLVQAQVYGARVVALEGNFDQALEVVRALSRDYPVTLVNSVNPHRIEGQKTAAFEIVDELGDAPDMLFIPVGNAGNITAYWKGFREYHAAGAGTRLPRMIGAQAEGAAPIVRNQPVAEPKTIASAIRIGNPASWEQATMARDDSGGAIESVSDGEILNAQRVLASTEGIFAEPASSASVALLLKLANARRVPAGGTVVCVLTGSGLKDPAATEEHLLPPLRLPADARAVAKALKL
ncbi:MAG TPA: threonine synthase [Candidatus Dormibacteraeota bacterium]|jgi:threonine synthase|nr:threonine synthase [Candidatus Dormibacteraeota bacterium]